MSAKYLNTYPDLFIIHLVGLALFIPQSFCSNTTCPPPHFPERGGYEPIKSKYEFGETISYDCNSSILFYVKDDDLYAARKEVTCLFGGKWSGGTHFCAVAENMKVTKENLTVFDDNLKTCHEVQRGSKGIFGFYLDRETTPFVAIMCYGKGSGSFHVSFRSADFGIKYDGDQVKGKCRVLDLRKAYPNKTKYISLEVTTDPNSFIEVCEVLAYMKDDIWCEHPPETFVPNGHLEVSRNRAVLHCHEGFKEKEGKSVHAICTEDKWSILNLVCVGEKDEGCEPLPEISVQNGRLEGSENSVVLHCNDGFKERDGKDVYATCKNKKWSFLNLQCIENNDEWCEPLPEISVPNGRLEVSRNKAVLHCNEGFKEKDGKEVYATCESKKWLFMNLQCIEQNDDRCEPLPEISVPNGRLEVNQNRTVLHCNDGFKEKDGRVVYATCESKKWLFLNLQCVEKNDEWCEPLPEISVPNGRLEVNQNRTILLCNDGFKEKDGKEVYATCENKKWLLMNLQCVEKNDEWCEPLPDISVPNGRLEVSRNKAVLHCNDGFKEKDGKEVYATCENQKWLFMNLQCVEKNEDKFQMDHNILDIVIGSTASIMIVVLLGVIIFLISKRPGGTSVEYEHYENVIPSVGFIARGPAEEQITYVNMKQSKMSR